MLDSFEWRYTLVSREDLLLRGAPKARILFVNCSNPPPPAHAAKLGGLVKRLLHGGGRVVTSDWSVDPYLTEAFPSIVEAMGAPRSQRNTTVEVEAVGEDSLLAGVFPRGGESHWWLEDSSTMVSVSDKATMLVVSDQMRERYGWRGVAFKFPYGEGVVIHLVGHFYQEDVLRRLNLKDQNLSYTRMIRNGLPMKRTLSGFLPATCESGLSSGLLS